MITWTLPWPVGATVNHLYVRGLTGRAVHLGERARQWRDEAIVIVRQSGLRPPPGRLSVAVDYWPPRDGRQHDADNLLKAVVDTVFIACGGTDDVVWRVAATRHRRADLPRIVVSVETFEEESTDA